MLTITVTIRMASYPNDPSVGLTGTCLPKDTAGSQRKHETHTGGKGSAHSDVCISVCS